MIYNIFIFKHIYIFRIKNNNYNIFPSVHYQLQQDQQVHILPLLCVGRSLPILAIVFIARLERPSGSHFRAY